VTDGRGVAVDATGVATLADPNGLYTSHTRYDAQGDVVSAGTPAHHHDAQWDHDDRARHDQLQLRRGRQPAGRGLGQRERERRARELHHELRL